MSPLLTALLPESELPVSCPSEPPSHSLSSCGSAGISQVAYKLGFQVPEDHLLPNAAPGASSTLHDISVAAMRSGHMQQVRWLVRHCSPLLVCPCGCPCASTSGTHLFIYMVSLGPGSGRIELSCSSVHACQWCLIIKKCLALTLYWAIAFCHACRPRSCII